MIKINCKIQFVFFVICLFFIGIGIYETLDEGLKTGTDLFWQISHFVPFVMGAIIFGINVYSKRIENFKN
jgi:Na+/glutamate symporter